MHDEPALSHSPHITREESEDAIRIRWLVPNTLPARPILLTQGGFMSAYLLNLLYQTSLPRPPISATMIALLVASAMLSIGGTALLLRQQIPAAITLTADELIYFTGWHHSDIVLPRSLPLQRRVLRRADITGLRVAPIGMASQTLGQHAVVLTHKGKDIRLGRVLSHVDALWLEAELLRWLGPDEPAEQHKPPSPRLLDLLEKHRDRPARPHTDNDKATAGVS